MKIRRRKKKHKIKIEFGGFYGPHPDYVDENGNVDPRYLTIGIHDGWYYPTEEEMKIYWENVDEVIYGRNKD